jgi:type VI protein secretion system component Hcp
MATFFQNALESNVGSVARPSKFDALLHIPDEIIDNLSGAGIHGKGMSFKLLEYSIKTARFPSVTHQPIEFKLLGKNIPIPGLTKYNQTWECTFYLTEDHALRHLFIYWITELDKRKYHKPHDTKKHFDESYTPLQKLITSNIKITQLDFDLNSPYESGRNTNKFAWAEYTLHNCYPIDISNTETNYESIGAISEFTVTFTYSHFTFENNQQKKNDVEQALDNLSKNVSGAVNKFAKDMGDSISGALGIKPDDRQARNIAGAGGLTSSGYSIGGLSASQVKQFGK